MERDDRPVSPRLSLVTLGVADLPRARAFYEALGWRASSASRPSVTFFHGSGAVLALFGRGELAADAGVPDSPPGFPGVALACNLASREEVDAFHARAVAAGGRSVKPPGQVFWGGYSGYFADPDGHLWEVAHNPFFPLDEQGLVQLPE
jgi:hypothetical protein